MYGGIHDELDVAFVVFLHGNPQHTQFRTAPHRVGGSCHPVFSARIEMQFHEADCNRPLLSHFSL